MISALGAAASGMEAQMAQVESISNNLANVNTNGFKKSHIEFQDLLYETLQEPGANTSAQTKSPIGLQRGMGVKVAGSQINFETGSPVQTARDLDMMVRGDGFFVVQLPGGEFAYRRDGAFYKNANGRIETIDGYPLQPEIIIPSDAKSLQISEDGIVVIANSKDERVTVGQIQLATFINNGGLKAMGKNLFVATEASGQAQMTIPQQGTTGAVMQRFLETSNVDIVREMTDMIAAQRGFEMNSKVIQTVDQMLQHTTNIR
jgi:flagellar basal-body rod protein FlgG